MACKLGTKGEIPVDFKVLDRFHGKNHVCTKFQPTTQRNKRKMSTLKVTNTSAVEQLNRVLRKHVQIISGSSITSGR